MAMNERVVWVVASGVSTGRCRYCGARIVWAHSVSEKGKPSHAMPFTAPAPTARRETRNDETGVVFEAWPTSALHAATCRQWPQRVGAR